jgi:hypothetical protein
MIGGFSAVAAELSKRTGRTYQRTDVYNWHVRGTLNAAGQPMPGPVDEIPDAPSRRPRLLFDAGQIESWLAAGLKAGPRPRE